MDVEVDHYLVLGLPSGEEGAKLLEKDISKAYRSKALELHPDKRPNDPNAHDNFQKLKTSYEILKDERTRKLFDDLLRVKREQQQRRAQQDGKRRKLVSDLEERERAAFAPDPAEKSQQEEERIARQLREEISRIRAMHANKGAATASALKKEPTVMGKDRNSRSGFELDKEKILKVSWEKTGDNYTAERLRELFSEFGKVEDVIIKSAKKRGSALVVMATKDAAVAANGNVFGDLSNPLLVLPLQSTSKDFLSTEKSAEPSKLNDIVGPGYQAFEDSVLKKLRKAAERQK